jgi:hypothetical protein
LADNIGGVADLRPDLPVLFSRKVVMSNTMKTLTNGEIKALLAAINAQLKAGPEREGAYDALVKLREVLRSERNRRGNKSRR